MFHQFRMKNKKVFLIAHLTDVSSVNVLLMAGEFGLSRSSNTTTIVKNDSKVNSFILIRALKSLKTLARSIAILTLTAV